MKTTAGESDEKTLDKRSFEEKSRVISVQLVHGGLERMRGVLKKSLRLFLYNLFIGDGKGGEVGEWGGGEVGVIITV